MNRAPTWLVFVLALAAGLQGCERPADSTAPDLQPPRSFMKGGAWLPEATGYWFHQYVEQDELVAFMTDVGFACAAELAADKTPGAAHLVCERSFRYVGGLLSRSDTARLRLRGNGTIESAEAGCSYTLFDSPKMSGRCKRFVALGAVYPDVAGFARIVDAMLRPASVHRAIDVNRLEVAPPAPLQSAEEAVDRLTRWRFDCGVPRQHYRIEFRGTVGATEKLQCQQFSLRPPGARPQSQQVIVHYDSADLAVLRIEVRLDDESVILPGVFNTRSADRAGAGQPRLQLETRSGQRLEVLMSDVGAGSRQATREGFESLTPASQRDLLAAYLDKQEKQWSSASTRLSHLNAASLEWYGPQALPLLAAMMSDERPLVGAALLKYLCAHVAATRDGATGSSFGSAHYRQALRACFDSYRAGMPASIATVDRLLAQDLRDLEASDARALNAFLDFRIQVLHVFALGPDAKEARAALAATIAGKPGFEPELQALISDALVRSTQAQISPEPATSPRSPQ